MEVQEKKSEESFFFHARQNTLLYRALAESEQNRSLRDALKELASISEEAAIFWAEKAGNVPAVSLRRSMYIRYRCMRAFLGVTLMLTHMLGRREARIVEYKTYCETCSTEDDYRIINSFVTRMYNVVERIEEKRVIFFSSIILGFNDALIELTGVLVGFTFVFRESNIIAVAGFVTGLSASLSMAASAYQQARHEKERNPVTAALYTGGAYLVIATVLVLPFAVLESVYTALIVMGAVIVSLLMTVSFYSAILLKRRYITQLGEMTLFSVGVAIIAFLIGQSLHTIL